MSEQLATQKSSLKGKEKETIQSSPLARANSRAVSSAGSSSSSSSASDSDSDSDSSSSSSDLDSVFEDVTPEYLESLLDKARQSIAAKAAEAASASAFAGDEDEIRLTGDNEGDLLQAKLPPLDPGKLPPAYFDLKLSKRKGPSAVRDVEAEKLDQVSQSIAAPEPAKSSLPQRKKDGTLMTKKEMKAEKKKSASLAWGDIPTPAPADLPRIYREVESLRLHNALDPKRFYKKEEGEGKGIKGLPKQIAIGTFVTTDSPFGNNGSGENLTRAERKRTLVDELVDDSEAKRYAKKKFGDLQSARSKNGRGTFAKRFASRKKKW